MGFLGWLREIEMTVFWTVLGAHGHGVLVRWIERKLYSPFPIWNTFVLVPSDCPVSANPLLSVLALLLSFFRWHIVTHSFTNRSRNASGKIDNLLFASLALLLGRLWSCNHC